jgi:hypothetical protein
LLAAHPDVSTVGELKASSMGDIETYRCSCGALLKECNFWRQVRAGMQQHGSRFSLNDFGTNFSDGPRAFRRLIRAGVQYPTLAPIASIVLRLRPDYRSRVRRVLEQNRLLINLITEFQGGRIFLDGSKEPERLYHFQKSSIWNLKVVHLLRDGRGVTNSYMKHYKVDMRAAAREWLRTELACWQAKSKFASSEVLTVRYEDLCANPPEMLGRIMKLVGLDNAFHRTRTSASDVHLLGNDMRLQFSNAIAVDEKWKTELRSTDLTVFEVIGGSRNRRSGYNKSL